MRGWKKCASLLLVVNATALAQTPCPADRASDIRIGAQRYAVEVAATPDTRERGLSRHKPLARRQGMWFVLEETGMPGFWMRGMTFPIDLIWVSPDRRVVGMATLPLCRQEPCSISYAPEPVAYVLEIGAGRFSGKVGETVEWECGGAASSVDTR
jgi:hypothetical protein